MQPKNPTILVWLGSVYAAIGEFDKAISDFNRAIEIDPTQAEAFFRRGMACQKKGDRKRAISDFKKALEIEPGNERFRRALEQGRLSGNPVCPALVFFRERRDREDLK